MCGLRSGSVDIIESSVENNLEKKYRQKNEPIRMVHNSNFEPSMKLLSRILKVLIDSNSLVKTAMSKKANMNYYRLSNYLDWLQKKHLIESIIDENKIKIRLTESGREFVALFYNLNMDEIVNGTNNYINKTDK